MLYEFVFFVGFEEVEAAVDGFVADADFWHVAEWFGTALDEYVWCVEEVAVDVLCLEGLGVVVFAGGEDAFGFLEGAGAEADYYDVDVCFYGGFAVPTECAPGVVDFYAVGDERLP